MRILFIFTLCLMIFLNSGLCGAEPEPPTKTLSPYFMVMGGDEGKECFPLKATRVTVNINGVIADVKVTQEYSNTGSKPINARYVFPASTRAAVHGMKMIVGEDVVTAVIKERGEAKKVFKKAKAEGKSASLLQQHRPNVFSMDIANVMPGDTVSVELHYSELLIPEEGKYEFVYPTVVGPRYSTIPESGAADHHQWLKNPYLTSDKKPTSLFNIAVKLAAGLDIQQVACNSHKIDTAWDGKSEARIALGKNETKGGNRDFILEYRLAGDRIQTGMMLCRAKKENFFMLMMQPPERVTPDSIPPREYIFVVDVSGSMNGFPLNTAKKLLRRLIRGLRPTDRFNVILFAGSAHVMAPRSVPANSAQISAALRTIDSRQGGGGTELLRAMKKALALPKDENCSRSIVVVTDGFIAAERDVFKLIADNANRSNVFTFGIGSSVNRHLIEGMARAGQGEPFVVTEPNAAASTAMRFKAYIEAPVLTGIEIDFGSFDAYDVEPAVQPDLFAKRPLVVCGKWRGKPKGTIKLSGIAAGGPYKQSFDTAKITPDATNSALPYLWARKRLSRIMDFSPRRPDEETKQQVIQLGLKYHLLTRFTSFVAVHEKVRNTTGQAEDTTQPLPLPKNVSNLAVGAHNTPEPAIYVMLALFCIVLLAGARRRREY